MREQRKMREVKKMTERTREKKPYVAGYKSRAIQGWDMIIKKTRPNYCQ